MSFPETTRCVVSGQRDCGKRWLSKNLIIYRIYFDKLYIICSIVDQYKDLESINEKADFEFINDKRDIPSPDELPKELNNFMIFEDLKAKKSVIVEYFCRGRHNKCNMIYLNHNLFFLYRKNVRENCNLFFYLNE